MPEGFETFDQELDLLVLPDGSYPCKDVDQFERLVGDGRLPAAEAAAVRAEAARVAMRSTGASTGGTRPGQTGSRAEQ